MKWSLLDPLTHHEAVHADRECWLVALLLLASLLLPRTVVTAAGAQIGSDRRRASSLLRRPYLNTSVWYGQSMQTQLFVESSWSLSPADPSTLFPSPNCPNVTLAGLGRVLWPVTQVLNYAHLSPAPTQQALYGPCWECMGYTRKKREDALC